MKFTRGAALISALTLVAACGVTSSPVVAETPPQPPAAGRTVSDANDFYYFDGKPVPLDRATSEFVLGIANETDLDQLLQGSAVPATAGAPLLSRGRRFVVVTVNSSRAEAMTQLLETMRSRSDVWFTSPIYYQPATRVRVVPTDELIVKTKTSVTPDALSGVLQAQGLRQVSLMEGTKDQYLLGIVSAKNANVLRVAQALFATGLFQWAEPNFIQEFRRQG